MVKDPLILRDNSKEIYDHQNIVILSRASYDWLHLRLQDFKSISDYNSALFKISSQLKLCGEKINDEDMLKRRILFFMPLICSWNSNIKNIVLPNILS